jgi:hypothetical protein
VRFPAVAGASYAESRSGGVRLAPELGADILRIVEEGPDEGLSLRSMFQALRDHGWPRRDRAMSRLAERPSPRGKVFEQLATAWVFRAVRECYVDHDPATAVQGLDGLVARRHAFLESRCVLNLLPRYAMASSDPARLSRIDADTRAMVRSLPPGLRYEGNGIVGTPATAGSFSPIFPRP